MKLTAHLWHRDQRSAMTLIAFTVLAFGIASAMTPQCGAESYRPRIGERHPDFVLPMISDREAVSLSQFRGKKVLLIQFASW
jgi:hypothetical protein